MNRALILQSATLMMASVPRLILAMLVAFGPTVQQAFESSSDLLVPHPLLVAGLLLAGTCSADARSGLLRVILGRPVERARYLLCRWVGGTLVLTLLTGIAIAVSAALTQVAAGDAGCTLGDAVGSWVRASASGAVFAAFFVAVSAMLPGALDAVLVILLLVGKDAATAFLPVSGAVLLRILEIPFQILFPVAEVMHPAAAILRTLSSIGFLLLFGLLVFTRRPVPAEARS